MRHLFLFFVLTFIISCKKPNPDPQPDCWITMTASGGGPKAPVFYQGDSIMKVTEGYGYTLYFDQKGRLLSKEEPLNNPYMRNVLVYDKQGQVTEYKYFSKRGNQWEYEASRKFTYENGKVRDIRSGGHGEYYQVHWNGNNIDKVTYFFNYTESCTMNFKYAEKIPNPNRQFNYFYFVDNNTNDVNYKLPYYFSEDLLTSQETTCWKEEPQNFHYTFAPNGLIASVLIQQDIGYGYIWEYEYKCE